MGTYNYAGAMGRYKQFHTPADVKPYSYLGNAKEGEGRQKTSTLKLLFKSTVGLLINPKALYHQVKTSLSSRTYKKP
jgi:hypothetical protein